MDDDYTSVEDYFSNEVFSTRTNDYEDHLSNKSLTEETVHDPAQLILVYVFNAVIVAAGIVLNLVLIKGIVGAKSSGALLFVLQIALVDVLTLLASNWEMYYKLRQSWIFPSGHCTLYSGIESFTSVAIVYFIVGLNFHSISSYNLAVNLAKNALSTPDVESAVESLTEENSYEVSTDTISQKRSLTIDYRYKKRRIRVRFPILLVWFVAASESLPLFLFADITPVTPTTGAGKHSKQYCAELTNSMINHNIISFVVIIVRIILPTVALVVTLIQAVIKFYRGKHFSQPDEIEENPGDRVCRLQGRMCNGAHGRRFVCPLLVVCSLHRQSAMEMQPKTPPTLTNAAPAEHSLGRASQNPDTQTAMVTFPHRHHHHHRHRTLGCPRAIPIRRPTTTTGSGEMAQRRRMAICEEEDAAATCSSRGLCEICGRTTSPVLRRMPRATCRSGVTITVRSPCSHRSAVRRNRTSNVSRATHAPFSAKEVEVNSEKQTDCTQSTACKCNVPTEDGMPLDEVRPIERRTIRLTLLNQDC
uniref:G-protein coupled receptors family 1 profile domain-containing protein n=1 Tax=Anopheles culicifacies TaxID=139723 RepID=A0A182MLW6_9DIPT